MNAEGVSMGTCSTCNAGYYCPNGKQQLPCPKDTFSTGGAVSCINCASGYSTFGAITYSRNGNIDDQNSVCKAAEDGIFGKQCVSPNACQLMPAKMCRTDCKCSKDFEDLKIATRASSSYPPTDDCQNDQACLNYVTNACMSNKKCKSLLCGEFELSDAIKVKNINKSVIQYKTKSQNTNN